MVATTTDLYGLLRPRDVPPPVAASTTTLQVQLTLPSHTPFVEVAAALADCALRLNGRWNYISRARPSAEEETP